MNMLRELLRKTVAIDQQDYAQLLAHAKDGGNQGVADENLERT